MAQLILVRHGESLWNAAHRFTGWQDVDLSERGVTEAHRSASLIKAEGLNPQLAFTSVLTRAIRTLFLVLDDLERLWIPVEKAWQLNERHYGDLEGRDKREVSREYGEHQVALWRRSYRVAPPPLDVGDPRHPRFDPRYRNWDLGQLPTGESLEQTQKRVLPYWRSRILPSLTGDACVLVVAHGNSLRALIKELDQVGDEDISRFNVPTGIPMRYDLGPGGRVEGHRFLGDAETTRAAISRVAQGT
ncbi:phosphoglyceromutase [mine drainage metagenome]|uniref:phosphoglycerate mutase (2,3-diphosphoglycerate-dependent) n=1 Tax=mine drainage metagenome TaxID=410659 RepID=T1A9F6_9ZZZZ